MLFIVGVSKTASRGILIMDTDGYVIVFEIVSLFPYVTVISVWKYTLIKSTSAMATVKGTGILVSAVLYLVYIEVAATLQCYSCPASKTEHECVTISPCGPDEVCMLRRTTDNDTKEVFYESQCETQTECDRELTRYHTILTALVGRKRETKQVLQGDVCLIQCCDKDLCNSGCITPSDLPFAAPTTASPSTRPPVPTASTRPPIPTASTRPPIPTASTRPPLPTQSTRPPLPTQSTRPPLPTQSTRPPLPTQSTRPPLPTQSTRPPLPAFVTSLKTSVTSISTSVTNTATSSIDNNLSTQGELTDLTSKGDLVFPTKPHKTSTKIMSINTTITTTYSTTKSSSTISSTTTAPSSKISSPTTASSSTIPPTTTAPSSTISTTTPAPSSKIPSITTAASSTISSTTTAPSSKIPSITTAASSTISSTTTAPSSTISSATTASSSTISPATTAPSSTISSATTKQTVTKVSSASISAPVCPDGSVAFENSCYYFARHEMSFKDAENFCARYKSHLVHVDTARENEFLKKQLTNLRRGPTQFWIGITDEDTENVWKFYDNQNLANFFDWSPGEPDGKQAFDGNAKADCAVFDPFLNFQWRDEDCSPYQYSVPVCEIGS